MDLYIKYICLYTCIFIDFFLYCLPVKRKGIEYFARIFLIANKVCIPHRLHLSLYYNLWRLCSALGITQLHGLRGWARAGKQWCFFFPYFGWDFSSASIFFPPKLLIYNIFKSNYFRLWPVISRIYLHMKQTVMHLLKSRNPSLFLQSQKAT